MTKDISFRVLFSDESLNTLASKLKDSTYNPSILSEYIKSYYDRIIELSKPIEKTDSIEQTMTSKYSYSLNSIKETIDNAVSELPAEESLFYNQNFFMRHFPAYFHYHYEMPFELIVSRFNNVISRISRSKTRYLQSQISSSQTPHSQIVPKELVPEEFSLIQLTEQFYEYLHEARIYAKYTNSDKFQNSSQQTAPNENTTKYDENAPLNTNIAQLESTFYGVKGRFKLTDSTNNPNEKETNEKGIK